MLHSYLSESIEAKGWHLHAQVARSCSTMPACGSSAVAGMACAAPNGCGKSTLMRAIANGQLEGFPPKEELRTVYVEHDIDASQAETPVVEFVYSDPNLQGAFRSCLFVLDELGESNTYPRDLVHMLEFTYCFCRCNASRTCDGGGDTCFGWLFTGDAGGARGLALRGLEDEARAGCGTSIALCVTPTCPCCLCCTPYSEVSPSWKPAGLLCLVADRCSCCREAEPLHVTLECQVRRLPNLCFAAQLVPC